MVTANSGWDQDQAKHSLRRVYLYLQTELPVHDSVSFNQRQAFTCPDMKGSTNLRTFNCSPKGLNKDDAAYHRLTSVGKALKKIYIGSKSP